MEDVNNRVCPKFIVGLGASAGGLEALQDFFGNLPRGQGLSFIVVQHLSPDFKSLMDQLLTKFTDMLIKVAEDGDYVEPDTVYLIPPKQNMTIGGGYLHLTEQKRGHNLNLPIDIFLKSLAKNSKEKAIAVILSGTGSDGACGSLEVSGNGGLVIAQEPESAKFDGMPRSALATNVVNKVLSSKEIPKFIAQYTSNPVFPGYMEQDPPTLSHTGSLYGRIFQALYKRHRVDFNDYKEKTIFRRVDRRVKALLLDSLEKYVTRLEQDPKEIDCLHHDLLIGVTSFFRDPEIFLYLEKEIIPILFQHNIASREIRLWLPGCASGEEAYSVAILLKEYSEKIKQSYDIKMFASDINKEHLAIANSGVYTESRVAELGVNRVSRFFKKKDDHYTVCSEVRNMVVFAVQNVISDPPFTKIDMIICRNLLIYLKQSAQHRVISSFHFSLKKGGILFLGPSEGVGDLSRDFQCEESSYKIFKKINDTRFANSSLRIGTPRNLMQKTSVRDTETKKSGMNSYSYDYILEHFLKNCVVVNADEDVVHIIGEAREFLTLQAGRISNNINHYIHESLRSILMSALFRAESEKKTIVFENVASPKEDEKIRLKVSPIYDKSDGSIKFFIIFFERYGIQAPEPKIYDLGNYSKQLIHDLELQLQVTKQELSSAIEDSETTNEELQSTNEELLASNEELQSTNEELHSVNEELYTVNTEYQKKIEELTQLEDDIENLLQSSNIGTIFVDRNLYIRRVTPAINKNFGILLHDIGRSLESFLYKFNHETLLLDLHEVIKTGIEKSLQPRIYNDSWYILRISPYYINREIEGAVVSFIDISNLKEMEAQLVSKKKQLEYSSQELDDFAYFSAHDLKGLVERMKLRLTNLESFSYSDECGQQIQHLSEDTRVLDDIIESLAHFSDIGKSSLQYEEIDLYLLITQVCSKLKMENLELIYDKSLPKLMSDPNAIAFMIEALVKNGRDFNLSERKVVEIGVLEGEVGHMIVYVRDNGIGILKDQCDKIFKMFVQLNSKNEFKQGVGVGLSFCKRLLEKLGGNIWVESEKGIGSTFYFSVPC